MLMYVYIHVYIVGYISFRDITYSNILDSFPVHGYWIFKLLVAIQLILQTPLDYSNAKNRYYHICTKIILHKNIYIY